MSLSNVEANNVRASDGNGTIERRGLVTIIMSTMRMMLIVMTMSQLTAFIRLEPKLGITCVGVIDDDRNEEGG